MDKQKKISGTFLCLLILALVLALYYSLVYTGLSQKTAALSAQHETDTQQLAVYRELAADEPALKKSVDRLKAKAQASAAELGIPVPGLRSDIAKGLASAGVTATGITMSSASAGTKAPSGRVLTQAAVTVTADCTEQQLASLLHYFERGTEGVYVVNSVGMNAKNAQGTAAGQYTVSLNMTAYSLAAAGGTAQ